MSPHGPGSPGNHGSGMRGGTHRRRLELLSRTLLRAVLGVACIACSRGEASAGALGSPVRLEVLTYNVFGHPLAARWQRPQRFVRVRHELDGWLSRVDLVALQEAFVEDAQILRAARPVVIAGACGERADYNPTGLLLLSHVPAVEGVERFAFVAMRGGGVRLVPEAELDCPALRRARATLKGVIRARYPTDAGYVDVLNLHLAPGRRLRREQLRALLPLLSSHEPSVPRIVLGDWNEDVCQPDALVWEGMGEASSLRRGAASCGAGPTTGGWRRGIWQGAFGDRQLDHILVWGLERHGPARRILHAQRPGGHLSDHDAVWVRLFWSDDRRPARVGRTSAS